MTVLVVAGGAVAGYLLGAVSPATLAARRAGADLRGAGSGNPGATNAGRVLGRRTGVVVGLLDVAKGALPALVVALAGGHVAGLVAGFAAVLGHVTSPYLHGHGGKGVATAAGAVLGSHPLWVVPVVAVWLVTVGLTRWVALASVLAALAVVAVGLAVRAPGVDLLWAAAIAAVVVGRHRANFLRWRSTRGRPQTR